MAIDSIPDDVLDKARIDVKLNVFDDAGNEFSSKFRLCVDRAVRARQRKEEEMRVSSQSPRRPRRALIPT
jgi:hypothetical protein